VVRSWDSRVRGRRGGGGLGVLGERGRLFRFVAVVFWGVRLGFFSSAPVADIDTVVVGVVVVGAEVEDERFRMRALLRGVTVVRASSGLSCMVKAAGVYCLADVVKAAIVKGPLLLLPNTFVEHSEYAADE